MRTRITFSVTLLALVSILLACSDETTRPRSSSVDTLSTVPMTYSGGTAELLTALRLSLSTFVANTDTGDVFHTLFDQEDIRDGDEGRILVANTDNDPDFRPFAAQLTDGIDSLIIDQAAGGGSGRYESMFFVTRPGTGPDFAGYTIDRIEFRIDSVLIVSPGSNPNGNGFWTDYDLQGRVVVLGRGADAP